MTLTVIGTVLPFSTSGGISSLTFPVRTTASPTTVLIADVIVAGVASAGRSVTMGTVPMTVSVSHPMTAADHVVSIHVFNEKNPQRDVARFTLGPRAGKAEVATRIRLATSQKLVALARMNDGSVWSESVDVIVVLAACIEGES